MKVATGQTNSVLRNTAGLVGLLIYGEDWGLVRERALVAVRSVVGTGQDPFRLSTLTREEHGRLRGEASSLALGGGRRVIHVQEGGDGLTAALEKIDCNAADTLIVVEAGELTPRSKLRAFAERQAAWGSVACYISEPKGVASEIEAVLRQAGATVTGDALAFLSTELAGESMTRRSELDKLLLFAGDARHVDLEMAESCCSLSIETSLAAAVGAALAGRPDLCDALLAELAREGATGAGLLAVLSGQVQRMLKVRLMMDSGRSAEEACRTLAPPIYPRQVAGFIRDVQRWRVAALEGVGRAIRDADSACKRAASPDLTIASRLLAAIAARHSTQV